MKKAILLDRDGVLNHNVGRPIKEHNLEIYHEAIRALKLVPKDYKKIIITNQGWISAGLLTEGELHKAHERLKKEFKKEGVTIDDIYVCPHSRADDCTCRKPKPGMIHQARDHHNLDLTKCYFIGDSLSDIAAGNEAGCRTILVQTGFGGSDTHIQTTPDHICKDVYHAVQLILDQEKEGLLSSKP